MIQRTITFIDNDGADQEIPAMYVICDKCEGHGTHTNPNIDADGLSHDLVNDPEFMQNYRNGVYDIKCTECGGKRVILVPDESQWNDPKLVADYYQSLQEVEDMYKEIEAERRFGA